MEGHRPSRQLHIYSAAAGTLSPACAGWAGRSPAPWQCPCSRTGALVSACTPTQQLTEGSLQPLSSEDASKVSVRSSHTPCKFESACGCCAPLPNRVALPVPCTAQSWLRSARLSAGGAVSCREGAGPLPTDARHLSAHLKLRCCCTTWEKAERIASPLCTHTSSDTLSGPAVGQPLHISKPCAWGTFSTLVKGEAASREPASHHCSHQAVPLF